MIRPPTAREVLGPDWEFATEALARRRYPARLLVVGPEPPALLLFFLTTVPAFTSGSDWPLFAAAHLNSFPLVLLTTPLVPFWATYPVLTPDGLLIDRVRQLAFTRTRLGELD